ncbi:ubiquinol-cytochrome c reductase cytochrome c subunit [Nocardioides terrae]|uniref:Cytochrome bc1 complex cytochrome c subunit n=1 Tax=Nocardioides terrae TaxID=574651 RepID=A0A1I1GCJ8_9ACTN|nr:c-type cytochrome [Nocardioides terrae]SFC06850.1 ubiquinol-cytochrome c reductase cytochrome c subunit [Nocardioides terrae]
MRLLNRSAGRLSRHRRGPVAGLVVLLLGLLLTGGLYAAVSPSSSASSAEDDQALVKQGRELFLVGCAFCHGQNAEGQTDVNGKLIGPSLVGVGAAAVNFQVGTGRMPLAAPGQQGPAKPQTYSDDEISALAAYVASLAPGPAIPTEADYSTDGMTDAERQEAVVRGGQIFLTNCTACHNFTGAGGAMPRGGYAPSILNTSPRHIYEAMLTGPGPMDVFSNGNLSPDEKRDVIAYIQTMREQPSFGGFSLGNMGPVSEGLFAWLVGLGTCVAFAIWIAAHTTRSSKKKESQA